MYIIRCNKQRRENDYNKLCSPTNMCVQQWNISHQMQHTKDKMNIKKLYFFPLSKRKINTLIIQSQWPKRIVSPRPRRSTKCCRRCLHVYINNATCSTVPQKLSCKVCIFRAERCCWAFVEIDQRWHALSSTSMIQSSNPYNNISANHSESPCKCLTNQRRPPLSISKTHVDGT